MRKYIAILLLSTTGCSYLTMTPAPIYPQYDIDPATNRVPNIECTDDNAAPIADGVLTALFGAGSAVALGLSLNESANTYGTAISTKEEAFYSLTAGLLGIGAVFLASSIKGVHRANKCAEVKSIIEAKNKELDNQDKQRQAQEEARKEELRREEIRLEQERLAEEKRRQEEEKRRQEEIKKEKEIIRSYCKETLQRRTESAQKLATIITIEKWINNNCKQTPVTKMVEKIDVKTGEIIKAPMQVGTIITCSNKDRPIKLDGSKLSDKDVNSNNYEPSSSDRMLWQKDVDDTNGKCKEFDSDRSSI